MRDRVMRAMEELPEKNSFVCTSCDHHDITGIREEMETAHGRELHDRFSEAITESGEKSAFVCKSCTH